MTIICMIIIKYNKSVDITYDDMKDTGTGSQDDEIRVAQYIKNHCMNVMSYIQKKNALIVLWREFKAE